MSIYTAGIPAEYGRKMGGVVEVNTLQDSQPGFHGQVVLSGGSFDSAGGFRERPVRLGQEYVRRQRKWQHDGPLSEPRGSAKLFEYRNAGRFFGQLRARRNAERSLALHRSHELSRYDIPNEQVQQAAGQRQTANNLETMGIASYEHTFSSNAVADFRGMVRDNTIDSTPTRNRLPSRSSSTIGSAKDISRGAQPSRTAATNGSLG